MDRCISWPPSAEIRAGLRMGRARVALGLVLAVGGIVLLAGSASGGAPTGDGDGGVTLMALDGGNFDRPVYTAFAPGDADKVYVVEQRGTVQLLDGVNPRTEYLDIRNLTDGFGEQGLLSIAFHPGFQSNGLLYAYYTDERNGDIVVSEFEASAPDATNVDESTRRQVIRIRHRFAPNHNGGTALFGPDGFLYIGTGDGGGAGDPRENSQDRGSLLGKLLRIDPRRSGSKRYRSPPGNPFKRRKGRDEIYAVGLRNPYRFSFDTNARILIGDVGQNRFEEVDYERPTGLRAANFGWDRYEGRRRYRDSADNESRRPRARHHDKPVFAYSHAQDGSSCAIIGGVVVRDESLANLHGRYLYADACAGTLRSIIPTRGSRDNKLLETEISNPSSITANPQTSNVYATSLAGNVFRLDP